MDTIVVLKFGGSSVADNNKLNIVANKIIDLYNKGNNVVVVLSAQGKTTDKLISEAKELLNKKANKSINKKVENREIDALISAGEQMSIAKLSLLLNIKGYKAISLNGWQAGIYTDDKNQNAYIKRIDITRIIKELEEKKIVIVAGFQGIDSNSDITTLGRGGSDTTAVALAASLKAKDCLIFSDVDGVYTSDPNIINNAKKISRLSYEEMLEISNEGAKVLHNRCVEIGEKFKVPIVTKSTFNNKPGTIISDVIEENKIKSIVKKDVSRISIIGNGIIRNIDKIITILKIIDDNSLELISFEVLESKIIITFKNIIDEKIIELIQKELIE